jgi:hypothetical protein
MPEQLLVGFNVQAAQARLGIAVQRIIMRIGFLVFSILICAFIYYMRHNFYPRRYFVVYFSVIIGLAFAFLLLSIFSWGVAWATLREVPAGIATAVDRRGIWMYGYGLRWDDVWSIHIDKKLYYFGWSPTINITRRDGAVMTMSLDHLDVMPGSIDAAVRSYSAGTHFVDISILGH